MQLLPFHQSKIVPTDTRRNSPRRAPWGRRGSRHASLSVAVLFLFAACAGPFSGGEGGGATLGSDGSAGTQASGNLVIHVTGGDAGANAGTHDGLTGLTGSSARDDVFRYAEVEEIVLEVRHHRRDPDGVRYLLSRQQFSLEDGMTSVSFDLEATPIVTDVRVDAFGYAGQGDERGLVAFGSRDVVVEPADLSGTASVTVNISLERRRNTTVAFTATPDEIIMPPALLPQAGTEETYPITITPTVATTAWPTNPAGEPDETVRITAIMEVVLTEEDGTVISTSGVEGFVEVSYTDATSGDPLSPIVLTIPSPVSPASAGTPRSVSYSLRMWPSFGVVQDVENLPVLPVMEPVQNVAVIRDGSDRILSWQEPAFAPAAGRWVRGYELSRQLPGEEEKTVVVLDTSSITAYRWVGDGATAATYFIRPRGGEAIFGPSVVIQSDAAQPVSVETWSNENVVFATGDDAGEGNLWRITETPGSEAGTGALDAGFLAFNRLGVGGYTYTHPGDPESAVSGSVVAGPFDLRRFEEPKLSITTKQVTENGDEAAGRNSLSDQRLISVGTGTTSTPPDAWNSVVGVATPAGFAWEESFDKFHTYELPLQNVHDQEAVYLKFTFNSVDGRNNDYLGWVIGALSITDGAADAAATASQ